MNDFLRRMLFLPEQSSTIAREIDTLHFVVLLTTMFGATLVAAAAILIVLRYGTHRVTVPLRTGRARLPKGLEASVLGGLLALFVGWWVVGYRQYVKASVAPEDASTVYVIGKQWMWKFAYPDGESALFTLHVPARRPVKLVLTSRDVIHSFYVPDFRVKMDALPGRFTTTWFEATEPGRHEVLCAEYCGASHSRMRGEVVVLSPEDYAAWKEGRARGKATAGEPDLAAIGRTVAARQGCLQCHTLDGKRHIGPTFKDLFGATETLRDGTRVVVESGYVTDSIMDPSEQLVAGFAPVMPSYRGRMDAAETAAVIEFLRSLSRATASTDAARERERADSVLRNP